LSSNLNLIAILGVPSITANEIGALDLESPVQVSQSDDKGENDQEYAKPGSLAKTVPAAAAVIF
jgi:hypothetical protein